MDQFLTLEKAKIGPAFNSTAYIYIYVCVCVSAWFFFLGGGFRACLARLSGGATGPVQLGSTPPAATPPDPSSGTRFGPDLIRFGPDFDLKKGDFGSKSGQIGKFFFGVGEDGDGEIFPFSFVFLIFFFFVFSSGPEKGVITKGVFSLEESLESLKSL